MFPKSQHSVCLLSPLSLLASFLHLAPVIFLPLYVLLAICRLDVTSCSPVWIQGTFYQGGGYSCEQTFLRFLTLDIFLGQYFLENSFPWVPSKDIYHFSKCSCCIWIISVQYFLGLGVIPSKDGFCVLECLFRRSIFNSIYFELTRGHIGQWGVLCAKCRKVVDDLCLRV